MSRRVPWYIPTSAGKPTRMREIQPRAAESRREQRAASAKIDGGKREIVDYLARRAAAGAP